MVKAMRLKQKSKNMRWHEFILSNSPQHRYRRHLLCWLLWWIYIVFAIFFTPEPIPSRIPGVLADFKHHQPGLLQLGYLQYCILVSIKSILLLLTHLLFCYSVIYVLLPSFLSNKKYSSLITIVLTACTLMLITGYFLYTTIFLLVRKYKKGSVDSEWFSICVVLPLLSARDNCRILFTPFRNLSKLIGLSKKSTASSSKPSTAYFR